MASCPTKPGCMQAKNGKDGSQQFVKWDLCFMTPSEWECDYPLLLPKGISSDLAN